MSHPPMSQPGDQSQSPITGCGLTLTIRERPRGPDTQIYSMMRNLPAQGCPVVDRMDAVGYFLTSRLAQRSEKARKSGELSGPPLTTTGTSRQWLQSLSVMRCCAPAQFLPALPDRCNRSAVHSRGRPP